jgi:nascent polypeptide-associated complex subunit alpha
MTDKEEKPTEITTEKEEKDIKDDDSSDEGDATAETKDGNVAGGKKANKGEKKFKKAMSKLGLKAVAGINRVTIKKSKAFFLYIDEPEVLQSPGAENTFVVFGEAKIQDFSSALGQREAQNLSNPEKTLAQPNVEETSAPKEDPKASDESKGDDEDIDAGDLPTDTIEMVMNHTSCTKAQAIKALKDNNGDSVTAIIQLTG